MTHRITRNKRTKKNKRTRRNIKGGNPAIINQFIEACRNGDLNAVQNIYQQNANVLNSSKIIKKGFENACDGEHVNIAEWLYQTFPQFIYTTNDYEYYMQFEDCCLKGGNLEIGQLLLQVSPNLLPTDPDDIDDIHEMVFDALDNGHVNVAQWILQVRPHYDIVPDSYDFFTDACKSGHLDVAKWLFQLNPDVNNMKKSQYYFYIACSNGHLDLAKWLFQISSNIDLRSKSTKKAFKLACIKNFNNVAEWLHTKDPSRFSFKYDETGEPVCKVRKINPKWESRKMGIVAMKKGNNLLGRLPTDVAKMALEYV